MFSEYCLDILMAFPDVYTFNDFNDYFPAYFNNAISFFYGPHWKLSPQEGQR